MIAFALGILLGLILVHIFALLLLLQIRDELRRHHDAIECHLSCQDMRRDVDRLQDKPERWDA